MPLVLGCTHYPPLSGIIQMAVGMDVALISQEETTKDLWRFLTEQDLLWRQLSRMTNGY